MRCAPLLAVALAAALAASPVQAQDDEVIAEIREVWTACSNLLEMTAGEWTGWRRGFDGGYADHFEFHTGADDVSVLVQTWLIDAIATQTDTSCYRPDGTLAFIFSRMTSPNMAAGAGSGALTREGRIYVSPEGEVIRVLGRITEDGSKVADMDDDRYRLARGCALTQPHLTPDEVRWHLQAELGDIEGVRPEFTAETLDWCSMAARAD